jgi:hypothetical protein
MIRCCLLASQTFRATVSGMRVRSIKMSFGRQSALQPRMRPRFDPKPMRCSVPVNLDVEQYSVDVRLNISHINPDTSTVDADILKLKQIIGWFKDEAPTLEVGFYDVAAPVGGLPVPVNDAELATLYPSLYTADTDPAKWVAYAQRYISEAKRIGAGRPVRPFIWPQYHDVMRGPLAGTYIDYDYWMLQLTTIRGCRGLRCHLLGRLPETMG